MDVGALEGYSTAERADAIDQLHGLMSATHAQLLELVADYDRRQDWREDGATSMADWLVARLGLAHRQAREWVRVARSLDEMPTLAAAFGEGRLCFDQLAPATKLADPETEAAVAERARGCSAAQLDAAARRGRPVPTKEANDAHRRRSLRLWWDEEGGVLRISGRLADAEGAVVATAIGRLAEVAGPDPVTKLYEPYESRCADALVELASTNLATAADGDTATVVIHADPVVMGGGDVLAEIEAGPQISTETARRLACDARWHLVAEGGTGEALGLGRSRRQVPRWLARQLRRRDRGCRFPGCARARWLHAHHLVHWADGGPTDPANLVMLCGHHHRLIHEGGWRIEGHPGDELCFVHPAGEVLSTRPPPLRPEVRERLLA
ncbi:MAG TPA: DUF222 domain-containing protein [Acidimicrobiales bacterium]